TTARILFSGRTAKSGCSPASGLWLAASATFASICRIMVAYGRAANARSWARRSFAAEIIFMALVICCVLRTERTRRRISIRLGIYLGAGSCGFLLNEASLEFLEHGIQLALESVIKILLLAN